MINEVEMKRIQKRLDAIDEIAEKCIKAGDHAPDEIRVEYRELTNRYNEMVSMLKKKASEDFMKAIQDEKLPDTFEEMPDK